jgi:hypothetical protein
MFRDRFVRWSAIALVLYGLLGLCFAAATYNLVSVTLTQVASLQATLETERSALVRSIRTASATLKDTASATNDFQKSIDGARVSADGASRLANDTSGTFRELSSSVNISIFGLQPLAGIAPQFASGADQLQQLAISLGSTRDALALNRADVQRVGNDLSQLQSELDAVATSLSRPGILGLGASTLMPFQIALYGLCLLVALQSAFSIVAGIALFRLQRAMGKEPLFPFLSTRKALPPPVDGENALVVSRRS